MSKFQRTSRYTYFSCIEHPINWTFENVLMKQYSCSDQFTEFSWSRGHGHSLF